MNWEDKEHAQGSKAQSFKAASLSSLILLELCRQTIKVVTFGSHSQQHACLPFPLCPDPHEPPSPQSCSLWKVSQDKMKATVMHDMRDFERVTPSTWTSTCQIHLANTAQLQKPPCQLVCLFLRSANPHSLNRRTPAANLLQLRPAPLLHFRDLSTTTTTKPATTYLPRFYSNPPQNGTPAGLHAGGWGHDALVSRPSPWPYDHEYAGTVQLGYSAAAASRPHQRQSLSVSLSQSIRFHFSHFGRGRRRDAG